MRVHSTPVSTRESNKTDDETRNWFREIMGEIKLSNQNISLKDEIKQISYYYHQTFV